MIKLPIKVQALDMLPFENNKTSVYLSHSCDDERQRQNDTYQKIENDEVVI